MLTGETSHLAVTKAIEAVEAVVGKSPIPVWRAGDKVWITLDSGG
jgi:hypothetical protein